MKTAIFIQDGDTQLVLTPENQWEESIVKGIASGTQNVTILRGSFYETNGGYWRGSMSDDQSLILRMKIEQKP